MTDSKLKPPLKLIPPPKAGTAESPMNEAEAADFVLKLVTAEALSPVNLRQAKVASRDLEPAFETLVNLLSETERDD